LFYRLGKITLLAIAVLPGLILFAPVFVAGKVISIKKSKEALAASTVKIRARDVMATWKVLVSLALTPALAVFYIIVATYWVANHRDSALVPTWMPTKLVPIAMIFLMPMLCYAALRFGEIGMDIFKSLRPLLVCLGVQSGDRLVKLRERRRRLAEEVTDLINTLGPEMFPDFDTNRIVDDPVSPSKDRQHRRSPSALSDRSTDSRPMSPISGKSEGDHVGIGAGVPMGQGQAHLPRNESFKDLSSIGFFPSHPHTPKSRSRTSSVGGISGSGGFPIQAFSTLDSKEGFEEVTKKIRGAMRERQSRKKSVSEDWDMADDISQESEDKKMQ
jgi:glycerol-3-phosphate O-acyltransferase / dihydroxyacetone phosphate acyltransferase